MYNFNDLKGKVVVITGGTGLIGKEFTKGFTKSGSTVVIGARNEKKANDFLSKLKEEDIQIEFIKLDISDRKNVGEFFHTIQDRYKKIDIVINNAFPRTLDWQEKLEDVDFNSVLSNLESHLGGYFLCGQKVAKIMKQQKSGNIINISSIYGVLGPNFSIYEGTEMTCAPAYPMIKGGVITMTKYFATYLAKYNIRVNCIAPGGIFDSQNEKFVKKYKELVPLGRMGKAEDIVGSALFLASEISSYITGQCLMVDGGWSSW